MKCDACSQIYCKDHIQYSTHSCSESYRKDKLVPVCPLCSKPIPLKPGEVADIKVGAHIDADCQSDPAKERRKVYTNRCSKKGCKVKEMVRVRCDRCSLNYCLKHRHENDHDCAGAKSAAAPRNKAASAAMARNKASSSTPPQRSPARNAAPQQSLLNSIGASLARDRQNRSPGQPVPVGGFQAGLTEEQALQRALALSQAEQSPSQPEREMTQQEKDDMALAQAIARSEQDARNRSQNNQVWVN